jgi:hypothetical protein
MRLTFNERSSDPIWTPDSKRIVFLSGAPADKFAVYWKAADGSGGEDRLIAEQDNLLGFVPSTWSHDGKTLLLTKVPLAGDLHSIYALPLEGDHKVKPLLEDERLLLSGSSYDFTRWAMDGI